MDEEVKNYLEKLTSPQKEMCMIIRKIILDTFPDLKETFQNGVPWYESKFYIVGLRDHVNIGFSVTGMTPDEMKLFEGNGKYMRHINIDTLEEINEQKIIRLLKIVK